MPCINEQFKKQPMIHEKIPGTTYPHVFSRQGIDLYCSHAIDHLSTLEDHSIHMVLTDPPYFLSNMTNNWNPKTIKTKRTKKQRINNLPAGMKFDPKQGKEFSRFFLKLSEEICRVLVPGGFFLSFSQARLYHHLAITCENAGFWIRDMLTWHYIRQGQPKAFTLQHFIKNKKNISEEDRQSLLDLFEDKKTPQLTPMFESIMLAQKPVRKSLTQNFITWGVGLIDGRVCIDDKLPTTLFSVEKPSREERVGHPTQKPLALLKQLVSIFSFEGQTILDPFLGSGTTAVAALSLNRKCIGIEKEAEYMAMATQRINALLENT